MSDISVTLTSGPTIDVEIIGTGPIATLPTASAEVLGGIKVGENLKIDNGVLSVDTATLQTYVDTVILERIKIPSNYGLVTFTAVVPTAAEIMIS